MEMMRVCAVVSGSYYYVDIRKGDHRMIHLAERALQAHVTGVKADIRKLDAARRLAMENIGPFRVAAEAVEQEYRKKLTELIKELDVTAAPEWADYDVHGKSTTGVRLLCVKVGRARAYLDAREEPKTNSDAAP